MTRPEDACKKLLAGPVSARLSQPHPGEGVTGCAGGVDGIALAVLADRPLRSVDLDDPLATGLQGPGQPGPV